MAGKNSTKKSLMYKGRPLVRSGNTIYYGDMADEYVAMLMILDTADFGEIKLPSRVSVQIIDTDPEQKPQERIKKKTEKANLYDALNIACIWLERMSEQE